MAKLKYILVLLVLFSSCKIGQKYKQPEMDIPRASILEVLSKVMLRISDGVRYIPTQYCKV